MQISPAGKSILGVYLIIVGLVMIVFHKQVKQWKDEAYERLPPIIRRGPTGTFLTVMIIAFGVMSLLIGVALLSGAFVQQ
jgi:hypothetical protein